MLTRKLGRSGIEVSAVGFGCWPIGDDILEYGRPVGWGSVEDGESIRAIHRDIDLGVTFFDTAEVYGRSEDILGQAFIGKRDKVVIATKFGRSYDRTHHDIGEPDLRTESMRRSLEGSLKRLNTDYVDLYQVHVGNCPAADAYRLRDALEMVVQDGKIRAYGWSTDLLENAKIFEQGVHCTAIQQHLNILEGDTALLSFCEARNLASINRGPLGMGLLTGKYNASSVLDKTNVRGAGHTWIKLFSGGKPNPEGLNKLNAIRDILTSKGRTMAQGAIAWLWGRSPNTIPIPGFKSMQQAEENAQSMQFGALTPDQMTQIQEILQSLASPDPGTYSA
jgi:aryl-alcohol dehydrogenase-like predicted oxidoreductase